MNVTELNVKYLFGSLLKSVLHIIYIILQNVGLAPPPALSGSHFVAHLLKHPFNRCVKHICFAQLNT